MGHYYLAPRHSTPLCNEGMNHAPSSMIVNRPYRRCLKGRPPSWVDMCRPRAADGQSLPLTYPTTRSFERLVHFESRRVSYRRAGLCVPQCEHDLLLDVLTFFHCRDFLSVHVASRRILYFLLVQLL